MTIDQLHHSITAVIGDDPTSAHLTIAQVILGHPKLSQLITRFHQGNPIVSHNAKADPSALANRAFTVRAPAPLFLVEPTNVWK